MRVRVRACVRLCGVAFVCGWVSNVCVCLPVSLCLCFDVVAYIIKGVRVVLVCVCVVLIVAARVFVA